MPTAPNRPMPDESDPNGPATSGMTGAGDPMAAAYTSGGARPNGTGYISMADYINGNQDAINSSQAAINKEANDSLDTLQGTTETDIGAAAKNTPSAINDEMSYNSGSDNDKAFRAYQDQEAQKQYMPGQQGQAAPYNANTDNPYSTYNKSDANTRNFLAGAPGDAYGGQKVETDLATDANQGAVVGNLANWGGVFDAYQQGYGKNGGYGDAGAAFDANTSGTGAFGDTAARGNAFAGKESGNYDAAIKNASANPFDTYAGSFTPDTSRRSGMGDWSQDQENGGAGMGPAPVGRQRGPYGPTMYGDDPYNSPGPVDTTGPSGSAPGKALTRDANGNTVGAPNPPPIPNQKMRPWTGWNDPSEYP